MTAKMLTATAALRTGCWRSSRRRRKRITRVILTEKAGRFYHLSPERENILDWYEWKTMLPYLKSEWLRAHFRRALQKCKAGSGKRSVEAAQYDQCLQKSGCVQPEIMVETLMLLQKNGRTLRLRDTDRCSGVCKSYIGKDNPYPNIWKRSIVS